MNGLAARLFGPWVRGVDSRTLRADLIAGILGALLVLPQGFAFATLAGLPPQYGLYTAIVPCAIAALFGSSRHVVSGPTNANSLALFATLAPLALVGSPPYIELALAVTVIVGVMQLLIGALRLGAIANFISPAALRGFMSGAAALIALHSLTDLLGLTTPTTHGVLTLLEHIANHLDDIAPAALGVGVFTIVVTVLVKAWLPRWPSLLAGLILGTALAAALNRFVFGSAASPGGIAVVGAIPSIWPRFHWPAIDLRLIPDLIGISFSLTIVALGQSISIAKAVAERSGQAIDANREFRGQGLSNIVGGFFSSYISCGSLNRSMPNYEAGAQTPLAAVFASVLLLLLVAASSSLLALIPMAAIAGLLLLISWTLFDREAWIHLWRSSRSDFAIAAATFAATISIRIEMAILLGTMLSIVTYLYRTSKPALRIMGFDSKEPARPFVVRDHVAAPLGECPQLKMLRMEGEVYFGAVPWVDDQLRDLRTPLHAPKHLLVMAKSMNFIDLPAAQMWKNELHARRAAGGDLYFHRPRAPVMQLWQKLGFIAELGVDHIFPAKRIAIETIFQRLDRGICSHCTVRAFQECHTLPLPMPPFIPEGTLPQLESLAAPTGG
ncbi:MAG: SulP family inorganic anion transporter [Caldimonas sp.]